MLAPVLDPSMNIRSSAELLTLVVVILMELDVVFLIECKLFGTYYCRCRIPLVKWCVEFPSHLRVLVL